MRRILALLLVVGLLLAGLIVISSQQARAQTTRMGSWLDSQIWFHQADPSAALLQMDNNQSQMWMFYLRTVAQTQAAQSDPNIGLISTAGSFDDLFVNPVAVDQTKAPGLFNPIQQ